MAIYFKNAKQKIVPKQKVVPITKNSCTLWLDLVWFLKGSRLQLVMKSLRQCFYWFCLFHGVHAPKNVLLKILGGENQGLIVFLVDQIGRTVFTSMIEAKFSAVFVLFSHLRWTNMKNYTTITFWQNKFLTCFSATFITIEPASRNLYIVNTAVDSIEVASLDLPDVVTTLQVHNIHSAWQMVISHELG